MDTVLNCQNDQYNVESMADVKSTVKTRYLAEVMVLDIIVSDEKKMLLFVNKLGKKF